MKRSISHRRLPAFYATLALVVVCTGFPCRGEVPPEHNVLIISLDTCRADHLTCYGYGRATSPNIDAFADTSTLFEDCLAPLPLTLPAHVSLLSGQYPRDHTVQRNGVVVPQDTVFLSEVLQGKGWETAAFISTHVLHRKTGFNQGFETFRFVRNSQTNGSLTTQAFTNWLEARETDGPFFALLHYYDIHAPYGSSDYGNTFCAPGTSPDPMEYPASADVLASPEIIHSAVAKYDGDVYYVDREIGKAFDCMTRTAVLGNTMIIIMSDHGESLGEKGKAFSHGTSVSQAELHVPLIIKIPWLPRQPAKSPVPVSLMDIAPTILDALNLEANLTSSHCVSLLPILEENGSDSSWRTERERFGQSYVPFGEMPRRTCLVKKGKKVVVDDNTHGVSRWAYSLPVPVKKGWRVGVHANSWYRMDAQLGARMGERWQYIPLVLERMPDGKASDGDGIWRETHENSPDGWVQLSTPRIGLPSNAIDVLLLSLDLGHGTKWEGHIDAISIMDPDTETWRVIESFEDPEKSRKLTVLNWPHKNKVEHQDILEETVSGRAKHGERSLHVKLRFPNHRFGKRLYDLPVDRQERINIRSLFVGTPLLEGMEDSLQSFFHDAGKRGKPDAITDEATLRELNALGYL